MLNNPYRRLRFTLTETLQQRYWNDLDVMRPALIAKRLMGVTDMYPDGVGYMGKWLVGDQFIIGGEGTGALTWTDGTHYSRVKVHIHDGFEVADGRIAPPIESYLIGGLMQNPYAKAKTFVVTRDERVKCDVELCEYCETMEECRGVLAGNSVPEEGIISVKCFPDMLIAYGKMIDSVCLNLVKRL